MAGQTKIPGKWGAKLAGELENELTHHPLNQPTVAPAADVPVYPAAKASGIAAVAEEAALTGRQVTQRFPHYVERIRTVLRQEGVPRMPRGRIRAFGKFVSQALGGRRLAGLAASELEQLESTLRRKFVTDSSALGQVMTQARTRVRKMTGATAGRVVATTVDLPDGVWVFVHTNSPDPVVVMEAFAPRAAGRMVERPAFPGKGAPRWLHDGATLPSPTPPVLSASPPRLVGPARGLLQHGPNAIIDQLLRAERHRSGAAWVPVGPRVVAYFGDVPQKLRRTLGLRIDSIELRHAPSGARGWDTRVEIIGTTGKSPDRFPDIDVLPEVTNAFGPDSNMDRLHGWGPILGDSTPAGGGYGPKALNKLQRDTIESYLQTWSNPKAPVKLSTTVYLEHRPTLAGVQPFVKTVRYRWSDAGIRRSVAFGVDDAGKVFGPLVEGL